MSIYIGLSGVAGSGKDLFFSLLSQKINCEKYSLADSLKLEVSEFSQKHYNIDALDCSRRDKDLIRPILVAHGTIKRNKSNGRHWIDKINKKINKNKLTNSIVVVTDIRYDDYPEDEAHWLKSELGGYLVHITLYEEVVRLNKVLKKYKTPINEEEARNNPRLIEKADFNIEWKREDDHARLDKYVQSFLEWLKEKDDRYSAYEKAETERV